MELCLERPELYRVKKGQCLRDVAAAFHIPCRALAAYNALDGEPEAGQLLCLPPPSPVYRVQGGEDAAQLCGSEEAFRRKNGTSRLYPGQEILL